MRNESSPNIDDFVDYEAEYRPRIRKCVKAGDKLTGLCPFHNDGNNSFSVELKTGKWHCFAEEIGGNFLDFYARIHDTTTKEAYKEILKAYGKDGAETPGSRDYTLERYSEEKKIPEQWLKDFCSLSTSQDRDGTMFLKIPYFDEQGGEATFRKRYAPGHGKFKWKYGTKPTLYGLWRMPVQRQGDSLILVEGESDAQTLWHMGLPGLGVPGSSTFKPDHVPFLSGMKKLYLHKERDIGGETFIRKTAEGLREGGFEGRVFIFSCGGVEGCKDPSDVFGKLGKDKAREKLLELLKGAEELDLAGAPAQEGIKGAPINLRAPEGWDYDETGIWRVDRKNYGKTLVCGTPILLTRRVKSLDTDDEKMEVAFLRTEGMGRKAWKRLLLDRDIVFTTKGAAVFTNAGAMVTSENAKAVIRFLSALEVANDDIIEWGESTSVLGWHSKGRFLPGIGKGIIPDFDQTMGAIAAAYHAEGDYAGWKSVMRKHREKNRFRFILAASFAAPLLKPLRQRTFFVYNWGDARGGKTAGLKAALSVWGDPDGLMMNFNTTQVGLERQAALFTDLPLGIDERQAAGTGAYGQSKIENLVYMIGEGKGRTRGARDGGIQKVNRWQTIAIATGEEPMATDTSQTGVSTRVIEICQGPFKDEAEAGRMHQDVAVNFGWAGPAFIKRLAETPVESLQEAYRRMAEYVGNIGKGKAGSHVAGIAVIALADALADEWVFAEKTEEPGHQGSVPEQISERTALVAGKSWARACEMAREIMREQVSASSGNVNENALRCLIDWIYANQAGFTGEYAAKRLGTMNEDGSVVYIVASEMSKALKEAGYNERKTRAFLAEKGYISVHENANGKEDYTVVRRTPPDKNGRTKVARFVEFFLNKAMGIDGDPAQAGTGTDGFAPAGEDEELPFD